MGRRPRILVIDDEEGIRYTFESFLSDAGYDVSTAAGFDEAVACLDAGDYDLILADILLGGRTGIDVIRQVRERRMTCPVVIVTGAPNLETATEAVRLGAFDYVPKPVYQETLLKIAGVALRHKEVADERERYRQHLEAIFRSVKEAIITVDAELRVVEFNQAAEGICRLGREAIGMPLAAISIPCVSRCVELLSETVRTRRPLEISGMECPDGTGPARVISISTSPLADHHSGFSGAVVVMRDETRLSDLERDLGERRQYHGIIGKSVRMQGVYDLIDNLADVQTTVLITGESGTGKELVAEAIHYRGVRSQRPLVKVNCAALPESLLESELFGHVKGAFTGAVRDKVGRFQRADGGTIFLDEIGDISPLTQLRLLRVLQEMEFERVGDSSPVKVDVRVIAATNRDLGVKVKRGELREDLYYRLKVVEIALPPLRGRTEDIPLLVEHFMSCFNKKLGRQIRAVSADVQRLFMDYGWPGNIRELEHVLEHAFVLCRQDTITIDHLPQNMKEYAAGLTSPVQTVPVEDERAMILKALEKTAGNKARAARLLRMDRKTLYRKLEKYEIPYTTD